MHGRSDKSGEASDESIRRRWGVGIFVLPVLLVAFLLVLTIAKPNVSAWISETEQAELVSAGQATGAAPEQTVPPAGQVRTVKAY
jgi:hypothetical protein